MSRKIFTLIGVINILVLLNSCDKQLPEWHPEYLGPLVKTRVEIEDITELRNIVFSRNVPSVDIKSDWNGRKKNVPPYSTPSVGPYLFKLTDHFEKVVADTFVFEATFTNVLPVDIAEGTEIVFRNSSDGSVVLRHRLNRDVLPRDTFKVAREYHDKKVDADVNFYLESFRTNGSTQPVEFNKDNPVDFEFHLKFLKIRSLVIKTGQQYSITDTTSFDFQAADTANTVEGKLNIFFENRFPLEFGMQIYFLDEQRDKVIDSLFSGKQDTFVLEGAFVNKQGRILGTLKRMYQIPLDEETLKNLQRAKAIKAFFRINTVDKAGLNRETPLNTLNITIRDESYMLMTIAADIKANVN